MSSFSALSVNLALASSPSDVLIDFMDVYPHCDPSLLPNKHHYWMGKISQLAFKWEGGRVAMLFDLF